MLSLPRLGSQIPRRLTRTYAEVVPAKKEANAIASGSDKPPARKAEKVIQTANGEPVKVIRRYPHRVPVREDHGLYGFFRRKEGEGLEGEQRYEVFETPESGQALTGRPWLASELRNKSFKDLHTLWYVAAREQNLLATQREETRRMGVTSPGMQVPVEKLRRCRKTMGRIKQVLNERRLAYEGARKLAEEQKEAAEIEEIMAVLNPPPQTSEPASSESTAENVVDDEASVSQPGLAKQPAV